MEKKSYTIEYYGKDGDPEIRNVLLSEDELKMLVEKMNEEKIKYKIYIQSDIQKGEPDVSWFNEKFTPTNNKS